MRKPLIAGNWKMHKTAQETRALVYQLVQRLREVQDVEVVICPPFTSLLVAANMVLGTPIQIGAQNMHWEEEGAFTGEISPRMIAEFARFVILGHSERRRYFCETNHTVNLKVRAALRHQLTPILCVGETLEEREAGQTDQVVRTQISECLQGLTPAQVQKVIIAYEPVWAIGTGRTPTPEDANHVHSQVIRTTLSTMFGQQVARQVRILYGGSVKPHNAPGFFQQPDIDGALVGGASLKADSFHAIVNAARETLA